MCIQYFVVWSFVSLSFKCLCSDEVTESVDKNKSYHGNDSNSMDLTNQYYTEVSSFSTHLITESRLSTQPHKRVKRVHVFRPLFVYRQEQIKRKRIIEKRKQRSRNINNDNNNNYYSPAERQTSKPCTCCNQCRRN